MKRPMLFVMWERTIQHDFLLDVPFIIIIFLKESNNKNLLVLSKPGGM